MERSEFPDQWIHGYSNSLCSRPGAPVEFKVSTTVKEYTADIVRLDRAHDSPRGARLPLSELPAVESMGVKPGRLQAGPVGSAVLADFRSRPADLPNGFSIGAWIYPTMVRSDQFQTALSVHFSANLHVCVGINSTGALVGIIEAGGNATQIELTTEVAQRRWSYVGVSLDSRLAELAGYFYASPDVNQAAAEATVKKELDGAHLDAFQGCYAERMVIAAKEVDMGPGEAVKELSGCFNGKIAWPILVANVLSAWQFRKHSINGVDSVSFDSLVAAWDFGQLSAGRWAKDVTGNGFEGLLVNNPMTSVTDHQWSPFHAREVKSRSGTKCHGYQALHFHDDDHEDCDWDSDFDWSIPENEKSGVYAARLKDRAGSTASYIPFVIAPRGYRHRARICVVLPTLTYLAYANDHATTTRDVASQTDHFGELPEADVFLSRHPEYGRSLYDHHRDGSGVCYSSSRRPILNMQPDYRSPLTKGLRGLGADLYLVDWLEAMNLDYDVITDHVLHAEGDSALAGYRCVILPTHPEYWCGDMLLSLDSYLASGGHLTYLGGNGLYWVASIDPHRDHIVECRRGHAGTRPWESSPGEAVHGTTGEQGGLWRHRGRPPQVTVGVGMASQGWGGGVGYQRCADSFDPRVDFIFRGIGRDELIGDFGLLMGGAVGDEVDRLDYSLGTPVQALRLATSCELDEWYQPLVEDSPSIRAGEEANRRANQRADMVYFETPAGGAVFSVGSMNWCGSLSSNNYRNNVSTITMNVLREFTVGDGD